MANAKIWCVCVCVCVCRWLTMIGLVQPHHHQQLRR